ncbi:Vacuolar aspartic protease [Aphelenchoides avenae]|nr:Vacuolar aspartic protease [Aphelenchus avenae]
MPTSDLRFSAYLTSQPLYSYRDEAYAIDVKLGTPAQTLRLSVDLMRPGITVAGASCKNCAGANKRTYDGKKSSSSGCNTREYFIGNATAIECLDVIEALDISSNNYSFLQVISAGPNSCFARQPFHGVVGLPDTVSTPNIFGVYMERTCSPNGDYTINAGTLTHGGLDSSACGVPTPPQPLENYNGSRLLSMKLDSVQTTTSHRRLNAEFGGPWRATFTTTSSEVLVPMKLFHDLNLYWNATLKDGKWTIDCDTRRSIYFSYNCTPMHQPGALSCFYLGPIALQQFMYRVGDTCVLRIRPRDANDPLKDYVTFGIPLFRSVCMLFDFECK